MNEGARRVLVSTYMLVQATAIVAWWVWLAMSAEARVRFVPAGAGSSLMAFAPGDLTLLALLPLVVAIGVYRRARWTPPALWFHAGACVYATGWTLTLAAREPGTWLGACLMVPLATIASLIAWWWTRRATVGSEL